MLPYYYMLVAVIWACYATYKTSRMGGLGKLRSNLIKTFFVNFICCPYCVYYAIKHKKI